MTADNKQVHCLSAMWQHNSRCDFEKKKLFFIQGLPIPGHHSEIMAEIQICAKRYILHNIRDKKFRTPCETKCEDIFDALLPTMLLRKIHYLSKCRLHITSNLHKSWNKFIRYLCNYFARSKKLKSQLFPITTNKAENAYPHLQTYQPVIYCQNNN